MNKKEIQDMIYALRGFAHRNSWRAITRGQQLKYAVQVQNMMYEINANIRANSFTHDEFRW
jgi:hypothetical protein